MLQCVFGGFIRFEDMLEFWQEFSADRFVILQLFQLCIDVINLIHYGDALGIERVFSFNIEFGGIYPSLNKLKRAVHACIKVGKMFLKLFERCVQLLGHITMLKR